MGATLMALIKLLAEGISEYTRSAILQIPVSWNQILKQSGHLKEERIRVKGKLVLQQGIQMPVNPAHNAYLAPQEKTFLSKLMKPYWSRVELLRTDFQKKSAPEQHAGCDQVIKDIQAAYQDMNNLVSTVGRKLGYRKLIVTTCLKDKNVKIAKGKTAVDMTIAFFRLIDLQKALSQEQKEIFSPMHYLGRSGRTLDIWSSIAGKTLGEGIKILESLPEKEDPIGKLIHFWIDKFKPELKISTDPDLTKARPVPTNRFEPLSHPTGNQEMETG